MTRDILLFGELRPIFFDTPFGNENMVYEMNEDLKKSLYPTVTFDVIPFREDASAILVYLTEKPTMDYDNRFIRSNLSEIITGEMQYELPYPITANKSSLRLLERNYFGKMWNKNSEAVGGDSFALTDIKYTANGMYLRLLFGQPPHR